MTGNDSDIRRHKSVDRSTPFAGLTPDAVLSAAEAAGLAPDGRLFALNSYENRVYRLGRDDAEPVILKFYRAERWSDQQIIEEHEFAAELAARDIPVAAPIVLEGRTLHRFDIYRFAAFPCCPGGAPDLDQPGALELLGRTLARIHAVGSLRRFEYRQTLNPVVLGPRACATVLRSPLFPDHMRPRFEQISAELLDAVCVSFEQVQPLGLIRLHGDCHLGNILWQARGPQFVDLDDCVNGPRIQDLWMFLSGSGAEQRAQWALIMEGYAQFHTIEYHELRLVEALRAYRMLNHAAWLLDRWHDPAFPRAFPWAGEARYWEQYVNDLQDQLQLLEQPPVTDG
jgi:Ser/Thr protein kinase RdoA (MazF antagonist)